MIEVKLPDLELTVTDALDGFVISGFERPMTAEEALTIANAFEGLRLAIKAGRMSIVKDGERWAVVAGSRGGSFI
jgi:hypothetical protein